MAKPAEQFPVQSLRDAAPHLRRPFAPEAVKWKIQTYFGMAKAGQGQKPDPKTAKGGLVVAHIDARLVIERLNLLVPDLWEDDYRAVAQGVEECALTIDGKTHRDVGMGKDAKALRSDSLKRAAVKFGVGVSLYSMANVRMWRAKGDKDAGFEEDGNKLRPNYAGLLELDERNRAWLREKYGLWLTEGRGKHFGEALDHGDEPDPVGDDEPPPPVEGEDAGQEVLSDERADAARTAAREAFAELRSARPRSMFPAAFEKKLLDAGHSHEALEALVAEIRGKVAQGNGKAPA